MYNLVEFFLRIKFASVPVNIGNTIERTNLWNVLINLKKLILEQE